MARILVVDDDPTLQKLVSETLRREGHEVRVAKDGLDAMVALKEEKPELLVMDVMMPELNGYDVCHNLKFDPKFKDLPIIMLTSREQELDPRLGALMGIDYLHKSCSPTELVDKVRKILSSPNKAGA